MMFKVVTLNLWNGGRLMDHLVDFLSAEQPDIIFLQEAYAGHDKSFAPRLRSVSILSDSFPNYDCDFAPMYCDTRPKEGEIEEGQLLLSKFNFIYRNNIFFDIPYAKLDQDGTTDFSNWPATLQHCRVRIANQEIDLLNVHGPVNFDGSADTSRRLKMSQDIISLVQNRSHVVLAGDFNVRPNTQTINQIENYLPNVFKDELTTTFNMQQKTNPGYATSVVDMMFVSSNIRVVEHYQPQVDISDHLPLVARVEL